MNYPMEYPRLPELQELQERLQHFAYLKYEFGTDREEIEKVLNLACADMRKKLEALLALPEDAALAAQEPNALEEIRKKRPHAVRKLWKKFDREKYADRLAGSFYGRMAGCTLGAPVEAWSVSQI